MKNLKYIALATVIGAWAFAATTFADDSNSMNYVNKSIMSNHKMYGTGMIHNGPWMNNSGTGMQMNKGLVIFEKYLRTDLTDADKAAIATIKTNHEAAMKALMESMKLEKSNISQADMQVKMTEMQTKMKALHDQFVADLIPYIAIDKTEEFKAAMAKMPVMSKWLTNWQKYGMSNWNQKWKNKEDEKINNINKKNQQIKIALPDSVVKALDKKIATFTTVDEKVIWLKGIVIKIDTLLTKTLSEKSKNLLNTLKNLVNERIEVLSWDWLDADALIDILQ